MDSSSQSSHRGGEQYVPAPSGSPSPSPMPFSGQDGLATSPFSAQQQLPSETDSLLQEPLEPPNPQFSNMFGLGSAGPFSAESPRDSLVAPSANESSSALRLAADPEKMDATAGLGANANDERAYANEGIITANEKASPGSRSHKRLFLIGGIALLIIAAAIAIPVGIVVSNKHKNNSKSDIGTSPHSSSDGGATPTGSSGNTRATTGGDGSTVTTEDGQTFTYSNKFGGFWVDDPSNPFNNNAQPNSWTPPLNTSWTWGQDKVYGVNLGGLFVLEPFIVPALFEKYLNASPPAADEWTLSQAMAADTSAGGGLSQLEDHYNTFITEQDIAQIAGAGLNWVRVPIPFWAIDKWDEEPFLVRTCWKYILRLFRWCRKYGLRINLDLHTIPGSQNSFNHSGKSGQINFLMGVMGFANAQRTLGYIRVITEFISQEGYKDLIPMFGIINEPRVAYIGKDEISAFYLQAYELIRGITGSGEGNGPYISIHDGFQGLSTWAGFFPGADRMILDTHPYFAFNGQPNTDPIGVWPARACSWGDGMNTSQTAFGITVAGEFSNGINDCGLYLNGIQNTHNYGGNCDFWQDSTQWNETIVDGLKTFALASMDALQNWFFWTWKIGNTTLTNTVQSPLWSYQYGLQGGWMPDDPRSAVGACASLGVTGDQFDGTYSAWQTGAPASSLDPAVVQSFSAWPPATLSGVDGDMSLIPTYTATAPLETLPPDTVLLTAAPASATASIASVGGDGWANSGDTSPGWAEVSGCSYPNAWDSDGVTLPTAVCTGGQVAATGTIVTAQKREAWMTPAPML